MTRDQVVSVVRQFYADRLTNDTDQSLRTWGDSAVLHLTGCAESSAFPCLCEGIEAIRPAAAAVIGAWSWLDMDIRSMVVDGNQVAVHHHLRVRYEPTGETFETDLLDLFTVEQGKIAKLVEFVDTAKLVMVTTKAAA